MPDDGEPGEGPMALFAAVEDAERLHALRQRGQPVDVGAQFEAHDHRRVAADPVRGADVDRRQAGRRICI